MPPELRMELGAHCADLHQQACMRYHLRLWFDELVTEWQDLNPDDAYRSELHHRFYAEVDSTLEERRFAHTFLFRPASLYDSAGKREYEVEHIVGACRFFAGDVFGYDNFPQGTSSIPRDELLRIRKYVVAKAQDFFTFHRLDPGSEGFVLSCWKPFRSQITNSFFHSRKKM